MSILVIIAVSIVSTLFSNGILTMLLGNGSEVKLNTLAFNQLTGVLSLVWLMVLLYYGVQKLNIFLIQDSVENVEQLVFTKPIKPIDYALSKIVYSLVQSLIFGMIALISIIPTSIFTNSPDYVLKNNFNSIFNFVVWYSIPLFLITGSIISILSLVLKNKSATYYLYGIFLILPLMIQSLFSNWSSGYSFLTWLDPTGGLLYNENIKYFTPSEINTGDIGNNFKYNRILWLLILSGVISWFAKSFDFEQSTKQKEVDSSPLANYNKIDPTNKKITLLNSFYAQFKFYFFNNFKKIGWYILTLVCGGYFMFYWFNNFSINPIPTYPITDTVILWIASSTLLYSYIYIGYRIGNLYELEKKDNVETFLFSKPNSYTTNTISKILSIFCEVSLTALLITLSAIVVQFIVKSPVKQPVELLFNWILISLGYWLVICFGWLFVSMFKNSKLSYVAVGFAFLLPIALNVVFSRNYSLLNSSSFSSLRVNDFAGLGYSLDGYLITRVYWFAISGFFLLMTILLGWKKDNQKVSLIKNKFFVVSLIAILTTWILSGSSLLYSQNKSPLKDSPNKLVQNYILNYSDWALKDNLTLIKSDLIYDLYPSEARYTIKGVYKLTNTTNNPIKSVLLDTQDLYLFKKYNFSSSFKEIGNDTKLSLKTIEFDSPILPQMNVDFDFEINYKRDTFSVYDDLDSRSIQKNGTFLNNNNLPVLGFAFDKVAG
ncbi:MAG: hypothetical protein ACRCXZ_09490, partial [Patescibacteria group bacterium]